MKEFDLDKAKAGMPIITRDGRQAKLIGEREHPEYPIIALTRERDGIESVYVFTCDGRNCTYKLTNEDLFMAPIVHKKYANFYFKYGDFHDLSEVYDNRDVAIRNILHDKDHKYIKTIEIEWEE